MDMVHFSESSRVKGSPEVKQASTLCIKRSAKTSRWVTFSLHTGHTQQPVSELPSLSFVFGIASEILLEIENK